MRLRLPGNSKCWERFAVSERLNKMRMWNKLQKSEVIDITGQYKWLKHLRFSEVLADDLSVELLAVHNCAIAFNPWLRLRFYDDHVMIIIKSES